MPVNNREQDIDLFFDHYRDVFNTAIHLKEPDLDQTAELFSPCFVAANPSGVNCGENDKTFKDAMKVGYEFYKKIGITSMEIVSKKITLLDHFHTMIQIRWRSNFTKKDGTKGNIEFDNIYFTQTKKDQHKVFAYITGDEQAALIGAGLV